MDEIIDANQQLVMAFRQRGLPVVFTTTAYDATNRSVPGDMGLWRHKIPAEVLSVGSEAVAEGFKPIAVTEGIGNRVSGAVEWNLFDIDAKFGDVEPLKNVLAYLDSNDINV